MHQRHQRHGWCINATAGASTINDTAGASTTWLVHQRHGWCINATPRLVHKQHGCASTTRLVHQRHGWCINDTAGASTTQQRLVHHTTAGASTTRHGWCINDTAGASTPRLVIWPDHRPIDYQCSYPEAVKQLLLRT